MKKCVTYTANNYAQALFEAGSNFSSDLKTVLDVINNNADFVTVISNPAIDRNLKYSIIDEIFKEKIAPDVVQFIKILIEKGRFSEFEGIYDCYVLKVDEALGVQEVEIVSAVALSDEKKSEIVQKLSEKFGKKILPEWVQDESIIAGLIFKIGDEVIDTSLKKRLDNISKNIR